MCRERRAQWRARLDMHERAGRITPAHEKIGLALLKRLGQDGRCDPSHETLAIDSGKDVSTVQRALKRFHACGLVSWVRRLTRAGQRVSQTSNAYVLTAGNPPNFPSNRCERQSAGQTLQSSFPTAPVATLADVRAAQAALARRRAAVEGRFA
jgi:DNA-binding transcriptional MocR family regulator